MMTVNELARRAGVPAHVVRYYTSIGLLSPRQDPRNRYRKYPETDVKRVRFIRRAKLLGFTLGDIHQILRDADRLCSPCARVREILPQRLAESNRRLQALLALQNRIKVAVEVWRRLPDGMPNGESICNLIEAVTDEDGVDLAATYRS